MTLKWEKQGKIFDPRDYILPNHCREFAQSPQVLVFDDYIRVYFSTRQEDDGKFLSHVSYVDYTRDFSSILQVAKEPVMPLGDLGCYDEHGIFPLNVLRANGRIFGYIGGWSRRVSVSVETSIGLAESYDQGQTFRRVGAGPVLSSSPDEPFLVGDPFVFYKDELYYMYYIFGKRWITDNLTNTRERVYKIGLAVSGNNIDWKKANRNLIPDLIGEDECQALPTIVESKGLFHMVFCYRHATDFRKNPKRGYRLGYAISDDLVNWQRDDDHLNIAFGEDSWDSDMQCYPHLCKVDDQIYLLYNGNEFGRFGFGLAKLEL